MMLAMSDLLLVCWVIGDRLGDHRIPFQALIFARLPCLSLPQSRRSHAVTPDVALVICCGVWALQSGPFQKCQWSFDRWITGMPTQAHLSTAEAWQGR
jgi:hypothetical protein